MTGDEIPTKKQLAEELGKFAKRGLGRSLPGKQSESHVQALSDISRELADDPSEDWPRRIAKVVIPEVERISPEQPDRLAIADVLAIDLKRPFEAIESGEVVEGLEGHGGRYARAAERHGVSEKHFRDKRRLPELERVGQRLIERLKERREATAEESDGSEPSAPSQKETEASTGKESEGEGYPPLLLVSAIGSLLVVIGLAWLLAVATSVIS